jgi:ATP-dependent RNA helicase DeaD
MPREIQRITSKYLHEPREISIKTATATDATIRQRYWLVDHLHKLDALTRILEVEPFDALLIFVRTRIATSELAEKLEARGYAAAALNGDMVQKQREQMIRRLKDGSLDILVATDVAARGLDVDRISHVINYDIPYDTEAYIHRIGRTGRAGRQGDAILFVAPRERRMLGAIEAATRRKIERLELPSTEMVNNKRIADFKQKISDTIAAGELDFLRKLLEQYQQEHDMPALDIAAALARISIGEKQWLLKAEKDRPPRHGDDSNSGPESGRERRELRKGKGKGAKPSSMERFRIEVGHQHGIKPGNIVGAIANEADLDAQYIGNIDIHGNYSIVDLPADMPDDVFEHLKDTRVCGHRLSISRIDSPGKTGFGKHKHPGSKHEGKKHDSKKHDNKKHDRKKKA